MITRENCEGVWAPILSEWDSQDRFDEAMFAANARKYAEAGVHTVYTTGTDGEFYAIAEDEFRVMVKTLVAALKGHATKIAIGTTAADSRAALRMIEYCGKAGAQAVMPAFPFWLEMTDAERQSFLADCCAAAGPLGVVHYNTARAKYYATPEDYARWARALPSNFVGSKAPATDLPVWCQFRSETPELVHIVMEATAVPILMAGGKAFISATLCSIDPGLAVRLFALCLERRWDKAMALQLKTNEVEHVVCNRILRRNGFRGAALSKALTWASGRMETHNCVRAPYTPVPQRLLDEVQRRLEELLPSLLAAAL